MLYFGYQLDSDSGAEDISRGKSIESPIFDKVMHKSWTDEPSQLSSDLLFDH